MIAHAKYDDYYFDGEGGVVDNKAHNSLDYSSRDGGTSSRVPSNSML